MAERRMFSKTIIDSDAFLDMPQSSQLLYFHIAMRADDEGFINNPKKIQRMIGSLDDDLKILITKNFIIPFETGVIVIKHWNIHNYIQNDRFKKSVYIDERSKLTIKNNDVYTLDTECIHNGYSLETQVRLGKVSLGKVSKTITPINGLESSFNDFWNCYPRKKNKVDAIKSWLKASPNIEIVIQSLEWQKESIEWKKQNGQFIPYPASYINSGGWLDEKPIECEPF